ncbi:uncharacterized protein [Diadema antillarum]|uniref:uncharacterized protein n=1 Tax=Diadema antillarum TaxID=105358 RepID=UPI003A865922
MANHWVVGWTLTCENVEGDLSCLDFNCSLSWDTSTSRNSTHAIFYTVYYARKFTSHDVVRDWGVVDGCANVSGSRCSVATLFRTDEDFRGNKRFRIDYTAEGSDTICEGKRFQRDPLKSVVLSAPSITDLTKESEFISFRLGYPTTHRYPGLNLGLLRKFVNHKYRVVVVDVRRNKTIKDYEVVDNLNSRQTVHDLHPASLYRISVKSAVYPPEIWSTDATALDVASREKAPSEGPSNLRIANISVSCASPDHRDVFVSWRAPDETQWNGELVLFEVRAVLWESRQVSQTVVADASASMAYLTGLSRWEDYEVIVFANTTAGGTRNSIPLHLEKHIVDVRGSQPTGITVTILSRDRTEIAWRPPLGYRDCIVGYSVTWEDGVGASHRQSVSGATSLDVRGQVTRAQVRSVLRENYADSVSGMALTYSTDAGYRFNPLFLLIAVVAIPVIVVIILLVAKWKYIKVRWLKPHFRDNFNFDNNKILKPAYGRQVSYEPCLRQEREVFNAPSPGVVSPNYLPTWSPDHSTNSRLKQLHEYTCERPLIAALLEQGMTVVDDFEELDFAPAERVEISERRSSNAADSAIDSLSYSDADERDDGTPTTLQDGDGYILHANLQQHLQVITPISDYTVTGLSGNLVADNQIDSAVSTPTDIQNFKSFMLPTSETNSGHDPSDTVAPYVLHSQITSSSSLCTNSGEESGERLSSVDAKLAVEMKHGMDDVDSPRIKSQVANHGAGDLIAKKTQILPSLSDEERLKRKQRERANFITESQIVI